MEQIRKALSLNEYRVQSELLSRILSVRINLLDRIEFEVRDGTVQAIYSSPSSSVIWSAMVHPTIGMNHYFAFAGEGMAIFTPIIEGGREIQLDVCIGLSPETLELVKEDLCAAIERFGGYFDDFMTGLPATVVSKKINTRLSIEGDKK